jgi:hypothetical protein
MSKSSFIERRMNMNILSFATADALTLAALFGASGALHLAGPAVLQRAYERWGFPGKFYRIAGVIHLLAALFLTNPITRVWGVALGAAVCFAAAVVLLSHGRYRSSIPAMMVLVALVPAVLAGPL